MAESDLTDSKEPAENGQAPTAGVADADSESELDASALEQENKFQKAIAAWRSKVTAFLGLYRI